MRRIILDWIVQIPHPPPRGPNQVLHRPVFQKRRLESPLRRFALVNIRRPRRARPHLRNVTVAPGQPRQARFRAHNMPVGIIEQTVRRHITPRMGPVLPVVVPDKIEHLLQRPAVEKILQLRGAPLRVHRGIRRTPFLIVIRLPLPLEPFRITRPHPEFRLLQMNRLGSRVQRPLHPHAQIFAVVRPRRHVINVAAVADLVPRAIRLRLVLVVDAVEPPIKIILVLSPGNPGHHMNSIPLLAPPLDTIGEPRVNAIDNRHVRRQVNEPCVIVMGLKTGPLQRLPGLRRRQRHERRATPRHHADQEPYPKTPVHDLQTTLPQAPEKAQFGRHSLRAPGRAAEGRGDTLWSPRTARSRPLIHTPTGVKYLFPGSALVRRPEKGKVQNLVTLTATPLS